MFLLVAAFVIADALLCDFRDDKCAKEIAELVNNLPHNKHDQCAVNSSQITAIDFEEDVNKDGHRYCKYCDRYHESTTCPLSLKFRYKKLITDNQVLDGESPGILLGIPKGLYITKSKIKGAGRGVFAYHTFHEGTIFGHYKGEIASVWKDSCPYCFLVYKKGQLSHRIDAKDQRKSNWMRYVNCPHNNHKANLKSFAYDQRIYYEVVKTIHPDDELLVWYGDAYGYHLASKTKNQFSAVQYVDFFSWTFGTCTYT